MIWYKFTKVSKGLLPLFLEQKKIAVVWVIPKDNNFRYIYTEVITGECSVSTSKSYNAVMTANFHYQCSMVNSSVSSKHFIFNAFKSIKIYTFTFWSQHGNLQHIFCPQNGFLTALPYLVMWFCSMGSGWLCDMLITRGYLSTTVARKIFTTIGR